MSKRGFTSAAWLFMWVRSPATSLKNLTWRSFWNDSGADGKISDAWHIQGWPTIFVLDAKGVIRYKNVRGDDLDDAIAALLAEMGHEVEIKHEEEEDSEGADSEP